MNTSDILNSLYHVSLYKTLRFNFHYFGLKGMLRFPVVVSRNYQLHTLKGSVYLDDYSFCKMTLGFGSVGIFDRHYDKGIWQNSGDVFVRGRCAFGHGSKISNGGQLIIGEREFQDQYPLIEFSQYGIFHPLTSWVIDFL